MRSFGRGLVAGFVLSLARVPLGFDLLHWPAVSGSTAYGVRALALAVVALGIGVFGCSRVGFLTLAGAASAYTLHGMVLADLWRTEAWWSFGLLFAVALAAFFCLRERARSTADAAEHESEALERATLLEMLGLLLAGAGVAIAIEAVARHLRLFGAGESQDDSVFGAVFLAAVAIGALAFGWIRHAQAMRRAWLPVLLALAAVSTYVSLHLVGTMNDYRGLDTFLQTYGLSVADHGTLAYDALLAGSLLVLPAFLFGTALSCAGGGTRVLSVLLGATLGVYYLPHLFATNASTLATEKSTFSAELVPLAVLATSAGAALALVARKDLRATGRWIGIACVVAAACAPLMVTTQPILVLSPWRKMPVMPFMTLDTPSGLLTVEPSPGGLKLAALDGRALSPGTESSNADSERLRLSVELVSTPHDDERDLWCGFGRSSPARLTWNATHAILLIGQMTPVRWAILSKAGVARADRSAAWHAAMGRVEKELFGESGTPPGDILAEDEARARIASGKYALVIAPQVAGDLPKLDARSVPVGTALVAWFGMECASDTWTSDAELLCSADVLRAPSLGAVLRARYVGPGPRAPFFVIAGALAESTLPIERVRMRTTERVDQSRAAWARRLATGALGTPHEKLASGLAHLFAAQVRSSPFETDAQQFELSTTGLQELAEAALEEPENACVRATWESLATILAGKRDVEQIYTYLAPLADRFRPWPMLERALAHADLESLEPERAASRLAPLAEADPRDFSLWYHLGVAQSLAGDHARAATSWKRALSIAPDHEPTQKKLATALVRIGDPEGRRRIAELVERHPEDSSLRAFLGEGPYPEPESGYTPESWPDAH